MRRRAHPHAAHVPQLDTATLVDALGILDERHDATDDIVRAPRALAA
jgi:hypothetical protein